ncbi:MAG: two-CW domain-containing protein [bacterium]
MDKHNCWDYCECGRQPGGENVEELGVCPAAIDKSADGLNNGENGGRICWALTGTFCGGEAQGTFAEKHHSCLVCGFFKMVRLEEGRKFLLMMPGQIYKPHRGSKAG